MKGNKKMTTQTMQNRQTFEDYLWTHLDKMKVNTSQNKSYLTPMRNMSKNRNLCMILLKNQSSS